MVDDLDGPRLASLGGEPSFADVQAYGKVSPPTPAVHGNGIDAVGSTLNDPERNRDETGRALMPNSSGAWLRGWSKEECSRR